MSRRSDGAGPSTEQGTDMDPMQLVLQAEEVFAVGDIPKAQRLMGMALQAAPNDPDVLTAFGSMLAEAGNVEKAILTLNKAIHLQPQSGFEKFMYMGQLLGPGEDADAVIERGIEILRTDVEVAGGRKAPEAAHVCAQLASALCTLAELRLTSADGLEDIGAECEALLQEAADVAPNSPDPLQALASLRYEQGDVPEALTTLRQSISKWRAPPRTGGARDSMHADDDEDDDDDDEDMHGDGDRAGGAGGMDVDAAPEASTSQAAKELPSYEFRFECAKLLIELDETTDLAVKVIEELLEEFDDSPDTWHLLSLAYYGGGHFEEAKETLEYGYKLLQKLDSPKDSEVANMYNELKERIEEAQGNVDEDDE